MYLRLGEGGEGGGGRPGGGNAGSNRVRYCYRLLLDLFAASLGSSLWTLPHSMPRPPCGAGPCSWLTRVRWTGHVPS